MGQLDGHAVVITGSGGGIGAEYARLAAAEGAAVVVNDVDAERTAAVVARIASAGGRAVGCVADVSDWDQAGRLIDTCVGEFGHIDGLVNNAGIQIVGPPAAMTPDGIRRLIEINLLGTMFCGTHAIAAMTAAGRGSIVNVTSGAHMGLANYSIYGASKGAISSLTYCWALDVAGTGVRVNAISPRAATGMARDFVESLDVSAAERSARLASFPAAASNAPVLVYLLSNRASALHGQTVRIDGEQLALLSRPAIQLPHPRSTGWTVDEITRAFERDLAGQLMPPGLLTVGGSPEFATLKSEA
jgi:NAD(P)-dependent dehydrogenase (short-subunit alcohol dehydrogenase family)